VRDDRREVGMDQAQGSAAVLRPRVVTPAGLARRPAEQTGGMARMEAFRADDRWVGIVRSEPRGWSGWHHHGDTDTYFYVLQGRLEIEEGRSHGTIRIGTGEFCHVPPGLVHRERVISRDPGEIVLVRMGSGPTVVNVDAPAVSG
jgi:mannose-6-phosphate isomerase-like protein (cupin superfamily)